jgi:tRNA U54 and U55 pseudouridine synthase Pus10
MTDADVDFNVELPRGTMKRGFIYQRSPSRLLDEKRRPTLLSRRHIMVAIRQLMRELEVL